MRLTILGKSPSWSDAGGACSGYLVESGGTRVLVDCGSGVFGKLREHVDYAEVDGVVITHFHGDHVLDLVPFAGALAYGPRSGQGIRPRLLAPLGADAFFRRLTGTWDAERLIVDAFELEEYKPSSEIPLGTLTVTSSPVRHVGSTHAIGLTAASGTRIVFGADGRYSDELIAAARDADLLVAEATLPDTDPTQDVHMSAQEAGRLARAAGVSRLVLTHISDELDTERSRELAAAEFGGPVEIAAGGVTYEV